MRREGLKGSEILLDRDGQFVGIGLGYSDCREHGTTVASSGIVAPMNYIGEQMSGRLKLRKYRKAVNKWQATPFHDSVLLPNTGYYKRELIIDNTSNRFGSCLLCNGNWTMLAIGYSINKDTWGTDRRKFEECELLPQQFYMNYFTNRTRRDFVASNRDERIVGSWEVKGSDIVIFLNRDAFGAEKCRNIVDSIISALKNGNLGVVMGAGRCFRNNGLHLIDLEAAYRPRPRR